MELEMEYTFNGKKYHKLKLTQRSNGIIDMMTEYGDHVNSTTNSGFGLMILIKWLLEGVYAEVNL